MRACTCVVYRPPPFWGRKRGGARALQQPASHRQPFAFGRSVAADEVVKLLVYCPSAVCQPSFVQPKGSPTPATRPPLLLAVEMKPRRKRWSSGLPHTHKSILTLLTLAVAGENTVQQHFIRHNNYGKIYRFCSLARGFLAVLYRLLQ